MPETPTTTRTEPTLTPTTPPRRFQLASRSALKRLGILFLLIAIALTWAYRSMIWMPGSSHTGPLPPATPDQAALAADLRTHVEQLAGRIGSRSMFYPRQLAQAAVYLDERLKAAGFTATTYSHSVRGTQCPNIEAELRGTSKPEEIIVIGAHYDAFQGTPGADDNASGCAGVLEIARRMKAAGPRARTIRFVLFSNEEPPNFWTPDMGSWVYAKGCRERGETIVAMLSLEAIGYYDSAPGSQKYPFPLSLLYPDTGDFIGFVGHYRYRDLTRRVIASFRASTPYPSEGAALFSAIPGVGWSDHWSFWQEGYPALMVTNTATFRNPHYHQPGDTPQTLDYERMARVVEGVERVVVDLAENGP
jgi:Zn-dependent M28 family amino/carboxypeptidase